MAKTNDMEAFIAEKLLEIDAVQLRPQEPFTWSSGLKSPIYCDNRLTISYPEIRDAIADAFVKIIEEEYPETELIAGAATGGIPHAAWVAQKLGLPMVYVRSKAKGHGKENLIEGMLRPGQKTIVIEDLISTGGSSLKVAQAVREAGGQMLSVMAIFTYELDKSRKMFQEQDVPFATLSNFSVMVQTALRTGRIQQSDLELLNAWRSDPEQYSQNS